MSPSRPAEFWQKPTEKPMPALPQDQPALGNRTILVLADSRQPAYADVPATTIAALHHWGMPYEVCDLARGEPSSDTLEDRAAILIPQEGLASSLSESAIARILTAVRRGTGLCSIDAVPSALTRALGLRTGESTLSDTIRVHDNHHFITAFRDDGEAIPLRKSVAICALAGGHKLLAGGALQIGKLERGRFACWGVSPKVWLAEYLGHAWGLDDVFWRSLVWVARKPFVMKAMPPFASMRFDDSGGLAGLSWMLGHAAAQKTPFPAELRRIIDLKPDGSASVLNEFEYVKILNRFGWRPEVSLFVDQVSDRDWSALKEIYERGGVQVSCHALSDGYDADGTWQSHFLTHKGLEVETPSGPRLVHCITPDTFSADSGRYAYSIPRDSIAGSMPNYRFARWSDDEIEAKFRHVDATLERHGIRAGRTTNIHWRNPPSNALEPLKRRGQTFSMWTTRYNFATVDPDAYAWRMLPYGDAGMCLDYMPIPTDAPTIAPTDFFNAQAHVFLRSLAYDPIASDVDFFRCKKPPKDGLLTHHDLGLVAESIAHQAKLGLQSLFFACPLTHEMNLATLTPEDWTAVMTAVERRLHRYPREHVLYDTIAAAARAKCETHIDRVDSDGTSVDVTVSGHADVDVHVQVYWDDGNDCVCQRTTVPPFSGHRTLNLRRD